MKVILVSVCFLFSFSTHAFSQNLCDLNRDSIVDYSDIMVARSMTLGATTCMANIINMYTCNIATLQRITNASLSGGVCVIGLEKHYAVSLVWDESPDRVGYYIYRGTYGGPYTRLNGVPVIQNSFLDNTVQTGTNCYVATATDGVFESEYSNEACTTVTTYQNSRGTLTLGSVVATQGSTVSIPITFVNSSTVSAVGLEYTIGLPLWVANATITNGPRAISSGKYANYFRLKAGAEISPLKCLHSEGINRIEDGVVAYLNMIVPSGSAVGTTYISIMSLATSKSGDYISMSGVSGKITVF